MRPIPDTKRVHLDTLGKLEARGHTLFGTCDDCAERERTSGYFEIDLARLNRRARRRCLLHSNADCRMSPLRRAKHVLSNCRAVKEWEGRMTDATYDPRLGMFLNGREIDSIRQDFAYYRERPTSLGIRVGRGTSIQLRRRMVKQGYAKWVSGSARHNVRRIRLIEIGTIRLGRICGEA
jgi:hypothetical protein